MNAFWLIASRETRETLRDLRFWISFLLLGIVLPSMYGSLAASVKGNIQDWLLLVLLLPATYSVQTAVISFVSEKEAKTIEPLLAIPARDSEIFGAKVTSAALPPMLITSTAAVFFLGAAHFFFAGQGYLLEWAPLAVAASVLLSMMVLWTMVGIGVVISTRTSSVRSAQQMTAIVTLPILLLVIGQGEGLVHTMLRWPLAMAGLFAGINLLLFRYGLRMMRRENILRQMG